jgi:hypothetical protein
LLATIRSRYTMEDERRLFDAVLGALAGPARDEEAGQEALRGSVEMF